MADIQVQTESAPRPDLTAINVLNYQVLGRWREVFERYNRQANGVDGLLEYSQAWDLCLDVLNPVDMRTEARVSYDPEEFHHAMELIVKARRLNVLLENFFEAMRKSFYHVEDEIKHYMAEYATEGKPKTILTLIKRILTWYNFWRPPPECGSSTVPTAYNVNFQTLLFAALPVEFSRAFQALCIDYLPPIGIDVVHGGTLPTKDPWEMFECLGLLERYEASVTTGAYEHIERHVLETCSRKWEEPMYEQLEKWFFAYMRPWVLSVYGNGRFDDGPWMAYVLKSTSPRFEFHMRKTLCQLRIKELFDIIVDYPDSKGALEDLKTSITAIDQRAELVTTLRKSNRRRLLHPGADTKIILAQYVQTIKCLRMIDPPGVLLFKVADPIRRYLRERPDTIRSIVANLVGDEDSGDSLVDEQEPVQALQPPDVEDYTNAAWVPEPVDAGPQFRANKPSDIISTLVSIYDSKDLFVKELQTLLAQRLMLIGEDYDKVEKERRNIEILKIRFGEAALQVCEVMLKDMTDSKRINTHLQAKKPSILNPTIISKHFWPTVEPIGLDMPGQYRGLLEQYNTEFVAFKPDKKLKWVPHLGTVHIELELEDRTLDLTVTPMEAAVIELFSQKSTLTLAELLSGVGSGNNLDKQSTIRAVTMWIDQGVLKEDGEGVFRLLEVAEEPSGTSSETVAVTVAEEDGMTPAQQQEAEQMKMYWQYIQGALTNLGALPLDRIQGFLRFAPNYDKSVEELGAFMESARRQGMVSSHDGLWKLASS